MQLENLHEVPTDSNNSMPRKVWRVWNRTGGATSANGGYMFDNHCQSIAEVTANSQGILLPAVSKALGHGMDGGWRNIVAITSTVGTDTGVLNNANFCVALSSVPDNEELDVLVQGEVDIRATVTPTGFTSPHIFARVQPVSGSTDFSILAGTGGTTKVVAHTLELNVWEASGTAEVISVYFNGVNQAFAR